MTVVRIASSRRRAWMAWSGGKNAAFALERLREEGFRIEGLVAWLDADGRLAGSGVPIDLVREQSESLVLPLVTAPRARIPEVLEELSAKGPRLLAFGDPAGSVDEPEHRELAARNDLEAVFPLFDLEPSVLARRIVQDGFRSVLTAVHRQRTPQAWLGRTFSFALLDEWHMGIHPTGGRDEFHSFVCGGPGFRRPVSPRWVDLDHRGDWLLARMAAGPRRGYGRRGFEA